MTHNCFAVPLDGWTCSFVSDSADETHAFGVTLAAQLRPGDIVALYGDLGSGKTCLIQGICHGLNVEDQVNSPTFVIINEYRGRYDGRPLPIYHFDFYRLNAIELENLGTEEYFCKRGVCLVEWADRGRDLLPSHRREIHLDYVDAARRRIDLSIPA